MARAANPTTVSHSHGTVPFLGPGRLSLGSDLLSGMEVLPRPAHSRSHRVWGGRGTIAGAGTGLWGERIPRGSPPGWYVWWAASPLFRGCLSPVWASCRMLGDLEGAVWAPKRAPLVPFMPGEPCAAAGCPWGAGGGEGEAPADVPLPFPLPLAAFSGGLVPHVSSQYALTLFLCCASNPVHLSPTLCNCSFSIDPSLRSFLLPSSHRPCLAFCPFELPLPKSPLPRRGERFVEQRGEMPASNVRRWGRAAAPVCSRLLADVLARRRICQRLRVRFPQGHVALKPFGEWKRCCRSGAGCAEPKQAWGERDPKPRSRWG